MRDLGRGVRAAVIVVSVAAVICGCTASSDEPATLPDTTPSVTESVAASPAAEATPSPSSTPTADPTATLEAEIESFILAYDEVRNASWDSDEALADRRAMFSDSCTTCLAGYEITSDARAQGLTHEGEPSRILDVTVTVLSRDRVTALVQEDVPAARLVNSDDEAVEEFLPTPDMQIAYEIDRTTDGQWLIIRGEAL